MRRIAFLGSEAAAAALKGVGDAHHDVENELPEHEWQDWYAQEFHRQGFRLVRSNGGQSLDTERVASLLEEAADAHASSGSKKPWPEFYSDFLAEHGWRMVTD